MLWWLLIEVGYCNCIPKREHQCQKWKENFQFVNWNFLFWHEFLLIYIFYSNTKTNYVYVFFIKLSAKPTSIEDQNSVIFHAVYFTNTKRTIMKRHVVDCANTCSGEWLSSLTLGLKNLAIWAFSEFATPFSQDKLTTSKRDKLSCQLYKLANESRYSLLMQIKTCV